MGRESRGQGARCWQQAAAAAGGAGPGRAEAGSPRPLTCGGAPGAATPASGTRGPTLALALPPSPPPCPVRPPAGPPPPPSSRRTRPGSALTFKRLDVAMIPTAGPPRPAAAASLLELGSAPTGRCRFTWPRAARPPGRTRGGGGSSSSGGGGLSVRLPCPAARLGELGSAGTSRVLRTQPPLTASWRRPPGRRSAAAAPWKGPGPHDAAPGAAPPPSAAAGPACSAPCRPAARGVRPRRRCPHGPAVRGSARSAGALWFVSAEIT